MKNTPFVDHGMYQDIIDYAALIAYQASLNPFERTSTPNTSRRALKVKRSRKSKGRKTSKRNFPKKMLRR